MRRLAFVALLIMLSAVVPAAPEDSVLRVAVASNFRGVAEQLAEEFHRETGLEVTVSSGATGALYNQITYGAPFDVFLSADSHRPQMLQEQGKTDGLPESYAYGRLAFWTPKIPNPTYQTLTGWTERVAMANPGTAPYGLAAQQVLEYFNLWQQPTFQSQLVQGSSIQQAWQFVSTGNVNAGFVALSQLRDGGVTEGYLILREELYSPIRQDAVVLSSRRNQEKGHQFVRYMLAAPQQKIIQSAGYYPAIDPAVERMKASAQKPIEGSMKKE